MTATKTGGAGPLALIGGKNRMAPKIIPLFPDHRTYVEPFCGGAQVFFRKPPSKVEVLNDRDFEIVNFFRVCKHHLGELVRELGSAIHSRRLFQLLMRTEAETLTDIQRAARFFLLQKMTFAAKRTGRTYGYGVTGRRFDPKRIPEVIERARERLREAQIECLPYEDVLTRYDRPTTFFYLDPPYWKLPYYRFNFSSGDFPKLAERLAGVKGRFMVSLNDTAEVRSIFRGFRIREVETTYSVRSEGRHGRVRELLILNYEPEGTRG